MLNTFINIFFFRYLEALDESIDRVINYYIDERSVEAGEFEDLLNLPSNFDKAPVWAEKYTRN